MTKKEHLRGLVSRYSGRVRDRFNNFMVKVEDVIMGNTAVTHVFVLDKVTENDC